MLRPKNKNKKNIYFKNAFFLLFCFAFIFFASSVLAGSVDYQRCEPGSDCLLGEYVFDDSGDPVDQSACVIYIKDPTGSTVADGASMSYESDGWHSYTFSASSPEGLYRSLMCCTVGSESACLDKSFILGTSFESIDDVETNTQLIRNSTFDFSGYADSGSATTLVDSELTGSDDYWNDYTLEVITGNNAGEERVVTDFNSTTHTLTFSALSQALNVGDQYVLRHESHLIIGIWNYADRTLTSATNIAGDIWSYSSRTLSSFGSLAADVWNDAFASSRALTSSSLSGGESLATETSTQALRDELLTEIGTVEASIDDTDTKVDAVLVDTGSIEDKVDISLADTSNIEDKIDTILIDTGNIEDKIDNLSGLDSSISVILTKWGEYNAEELSSKLNNIYDQVKEVSTGDLSDSIDDLTNEVNDNLSESKSLQNKAIEIKAMIALNRSLIENKPVVKTFYEWGSVVLKVVVANPSDTKQTINFRSALPKEIRPDDIVSKSDDLNLEFDAENDRWFASGSVELAGNKSETKFVEVRDIWKISDDEIASLRRESEDLSEPLKGTAFYAQSVTIKNDIASRLDKISLVQSQESITPEEHILNYRENLVELETAKKNIESLKELVSGASSGDNFKGSLMGISTTMTWAIILVVIVGVGILLIFLVIALRERRIGGYKRNENIDFNSLQGDKIDEIVNPAEDKENNLKQLNRKKLLKKILIDVSIFILSVVILSVIFYMYKNWKSSSEEGTKKIVISQEESNDVKTDNIAKESVDEPLSDEQSDLIESSDAENVGDTH